MKTYHIESLGCAKNLVDSEVFAAVLRRAGLEQAGQAEDADLVLVNTCSFLAASLQELDLVLAELALLKQERQIEKLAVTGCVMLRGLETFQELYPEVDAWFGLKDFAALEKWLGLIPSIAYPREPIQGGYHRYLRISDGCGNNCSYCAIPSIRGPLHSVPMEELVREAEQLAGDEDGRFLELVVIAQDTANYGLDLYGRKALPELLERLLAIPAYRWIRVMYMHPDHFEPDWLELWKNQPRLLPYFEIPIQHSEDRILKAMGRQKGRQQLELMFNNILSELPQAVLRSTLISGFPGESRAEGLALRDFIARVPFLYLGVFAYSAEEGTPAADMEGQVRPSTAERRRDKLLAEQSERMARRLEAYVGKTIDVLIEEQTGEDDEDQFVGRAWFQAPDIDGVAYVHGKGLQPGEIYQVEITDTIDADLFGEYFSDQRRP